MILGKKDSYKKLIKLIRATHSYKDSDVEYSHIYRFVNNHEPYKLIIEPYVAERGAYLQIRIYCQNPQGEWRGSMRTSYKVVMQPVDECEWDLKPLRDSILQCVEDALKATLKESFLAELQI